ncbi:MAG: hypothetical protein OZ921_07925 [Sorangiineae bacterium]|nr:hypothetical protein [Sorangiineae bacterium]MEB2343324.1 hypothetical protein [Deltaproteobacteria bacterium]
MALPPPVPRNTRLTKSEPPPPLSAPISAPRARPPRLRLRKLLALGGVALALWALYPRALSAWRLHGAAAVLADYALCMVGPTGPSLLRDTPVEFRRLVRRRLIYSAAGERPFERCAAGARELTGSSRVASAHRAEAWSFVEYGAPPALRRGPPVSIDDLAVSTRPLVTLAREGWPFERGGWTRLVRPSLGAFEATHPIELARPSVGRGLPAWRARYRALRATRSGLVLAVGKGANLAAYRSTDGGVSWVPSPLGDPELAAFAERCAAPSGQRAFTFRTSDDGARTQVTSQGPDDAPSSVDLAPASLEIVSAACDESALVAALAAPGARAAALALCPYRQPCRALTAPTFTGVDARPALPLDLARVDGATVLAVAMGGVVRVTSSRDDGRSWAPFGVAFDAAAHPEVRTAVGVPSRLLALGHRVLLYGGADRPAETYPVLVSDDLGAAWRAP